MVNDQEQAFLPYTSQKARVIIGQIARLYMQHQQLAKEDAIRHALGAFNLLRGHVDNTLLAQGMSLDLELPFSCKSDLSDAIDYAKDLRDFVARRWKLSPDDLGRDEDKFAAERAYVGLGELIWLLEEERNQAMDDTLSRKASSGRKEQYATKLIIELCAHIYQMAALYPFDAANPNGYQHKQHVSALNQLVVHALSPRIPQSDDAVRKMVNRYLKERSAREHVAEIVSDIFPE